MKSSVRIDNAVCAGSLAAAWWICLLLAPVIGILCWKSWPVLGDISALSAVFGSTWQPLKQNFGMVPFLAGTVYVTCIALLFAVPVSLLTAVYLSEYATPWIRAVYMPFVDILSGVPSVIYGVFGFVVIVPHVERLASSFGKPSGGYSLLSGSLVLAMMISPFIVHVSYMVLRAVPEGMREASLSLGATPFETLRRVVLRKAWNGVLAAVMLGLARALGETIAVLMVVGCVPRVPRSIFDPAYPLPALIANNYGEMMSIPGYEPVLMFAALMLTGTVLLFNLLARVVVRAVRLGAVA